MKTKTADVFRNVIQFRVWNKFICSRGPKLLEFGSNVIIEMFQTESDSYLQ